MKYYEIEKTVTIEYHKGTYRIVGFRGTAQFMSKYGNEPVKTFFMGDRLTQREIEYHFGITPIIKIRN